jgi:glycosyltransferase involved in cell wall biosynthesis
VAALERAGAEVAVAGTAGPARGRRGRLLRRMGAGAEPAVAGAERGSARRGGLARRLRSGAAPAVPGGEWDLAYAALDQAPGSAGRAGDPAHAALDEAAGRARDLVVVLDAPPARGSDPGPVLARAREVQAASPALAERALALGAEPARVRVVRPGIDLAVFDAAATSEVTRTESLRLTCCAPLHWTAGLEYVVVALRRLVDRGLDARIDVLGDGPARDAALFTASDLGILDRVDVRAAGSPPERARALRGADIGLFAPVEDRPWTGLLEALACGLPVVAADGASIRDAVRPGVEGELVAARDPAALADAVAGLAADPERRVAMGRAARARAQDAFDLERAAREVVA